MLSKLKSWHRGASVVAATLACTMLAGPAVAADDFPSRTIEFIVPYAPGGPLDNMARLLAEKVKPDLGVVVVENRPGAGGNIGAGAAAKAQPDGHTLVMGAVAINAINPWLYDRLPFDPVESFEPVTLVASVPNVLILNPDFAKTNNIESVQDLVEYARENPDELNYASGGNGSAGHLAGELLKVRTDIEAVHIPYAGAAPAKMALMSGEVQFMFDNLASAAGLLAADSVKALAVTTAERSFMLPDLPTMEQAGVAPFDLGTWFGVLATGGTPDAVVEKLNQAYVKALQDPEVRDALRTMGSDTEPTSSQEFAQMIASELEKYQELVKISGAKAE
ncbi:MAG TPA: tripartite tricarboxylate transporter substrate-binding protein [Burkholderiaceae bacterium]|nr:tripartite tricarboxylate transporter substrate-binding protein [Burkholderiaceae bacterium]